MHRETPSLTDELLQHATARSASRAKVAVKFAKLLTEDPERTAREEQSLCIACYYAPARIAGAAMTTADCACCRAPQMYGSTATDLLCETCAKEHMLCKRCGADIALNETRRTVLQNVPTD